MDNAIEANALGKRYRRRWALADCTLTVPAGQVAGLVGPNGAGKTTLLELVAGLLRPTTGTITVRRRTGFVAQGAPVYPDLTVADHLRLGQGLSARWDASLARCRVEEAGLDPRQRAGRLSGGQRAQLALTLDRAGLDQFGSFDSRGIVPAGYAAFAFALGVLLGALLRRAVPAMALTLTVFTAARLAFRLLARPVLLPPVTWALPLDPVTTGYGSSGFLPWAPPSSLQPAAPHLPDAWVTSVAIVNGKGDALTPGELGRTCPGIGHGGGAGGGSPAGGSGHVQAPQSVVNAMHDCVARLAATYHEVVTYQPASRYWPLQWYELGVFLAAALLLAAACAWRVRGIG